MLSFIKKSQQDKYPVLIKNYNKKYVRFILTTSLLQYLNITFPKVRFPRANTGKNYYPSGNRQRSYPYLFLAIINSAEKTNS